MLNDEMIHGNWHGPVRIKAAQFVSRNVAGGTKTVGARVYAKPLPWGAPTWAGEETPATQRGKCRTAGIEHDTPISPPIIATLVWEEVSLWLDEELPREWIACLVERAETLYACNARVRRRLRGRGNGGRDWLWTYMRYWLAGLIYDQRPDLHARLPASFNVGHPLPPKLD